MIFLFILAAQPSDDQSAILEAMRRLDSPLEAPSAPRSKPLRVVTPKDVETVKAYFDALLLDGDSARWKFDGVWKDGSICGTVNAKNRFGAYTGWQTFYYRNSDGGLAPEGLLHWADKRHFDCIQTAI